MRDFLQDVRLHGYTPEMEKVVGSGVVGRGEHE